MRAFRCRYLFPVDAPPIANGVLTIDDGKFVAVGESSGASSVENLGDVAIAPAFVNAHTHLEFSDLAAPISSDDGSFAGWIRKVVGHRRSMDSSTVDASRRKAISAGAAQSKQANIAAFGEIATQPWYPDLFESSEPAGTIYLELIGLSPEAAPGLVDAAMHHLECTRPNLRPGVSPHAPYSVHRDVVQAICLASQQREFPVAMHLAETREELQLLHEQSGPIVELLRKLGVWRADAFHAGGMPLDYLKMLAIASRAAVIHGNYLAAEEIEFIGKHRENIGVVFCPRTHAYFQHTAYPLPALLKARITVALGTDSRASNPDLRIDRELLHVQEQFPQVEPAKLLKMTTLDAAWCIGWEDRLGSLTPGKLAKYQIVDLAGVREQEPHAMLLEGLRLANG